jgi:hypothetical protein
VRTLTPKIAATSFTLSRRSGPIAVIDASTIVGVPPALADQVPRNTAPQQSSQSAQNIGNSALICGLGPNGGTSRLAIHRWHKRARSDIRTDVRFSMRVFRSEELVVAHNWAQSR